MGRAKELDDEIARLEALLERKRTQRDRQHAPALVPVPRQPAMPCSYQQEGMWFMHRLAPTWSSYHVPIALRIHGNLELSALERALHALVDRHEALRTRFVDDGGLPSQVIEPPPTGALIPVVDLHPEQIREWGSELFGRPFDLAAGPAYRVAVARLAPDDHAVMMVFHHIATDGWSARILAGELSTLYAADRADRPIELPPPLLQPVDYAAWQRRRLVGPERDRQVGWWRDRLAQLSTVDFPADRERVARPTGAGGNVFRMIPAEVGAAAHAYTREHQVSLLSVLHAGLLTVLQRYTGQDDLPVGSLMTGRTRSDLEPIVGYFGSIVVLRPDLTGDPSFGELVRRCHATVLDAITQQNAPFPLVVDAVRPQRVHGRNPLFQIGLTLNPPAIVNARLNLGDVSGQEFEIHEEYTLWDFAVDVTDAADGNLYVSIDYSTELFDAERMDRLAEHFANALAAGLAAPDTPVTEVEIMATAERDQLIEPTGDALAATTVELAHRPVERMAADHPDAIAVIDVDGSAISYGQLDAAADRLAEQLRERGVGPGVPVGIRLPDGRDFITALVGTWKAGGYPVPLDPGHSPGDVDEAAAPVVATRTGFHQMTLAGLGVDPPAGDGGCGPDDIAALLREAGATVPVPHRALHDQIRRLQSAVPIGPADRVLHATPYPLHRAIAQVLWPLTVGATAVLAPSGGHRDPAAWQRLIERAEVTVVRIQSGPLPALLDAIAARPGRLRLVLSGGDAMPDGPVRRFLARRPTVALYEIWGSTETFDVAARRVEPGTGLAPFRCPSVRTYVLDDLLRPAPVGVTGQLFVAGTTLAHGYLGEPGRTAQRFLPDPYAGRAGARMYATGDLVRRRADGALDYVGRRDRRITVRGERIDLGRIEAVLAEHPAVGDCGVVGRDEAGLTAYVSMVGDLRPESAELRRYVADRLPAPLVPRRVVVLPSLPRTPDGRPDLAALAQWPDGPTTGSPPRTALERWLASTWERLLGVPTIAADDNFFDLGGNSLHATQVVAHVREQLGLELPVRELLIHQTLDQLAARIAENVAATDDDLAPTRHLEELDGHRELSDRAVG